MKMEIDVRNVEIAKVKFLMKNGQKQKNLIYINNQQPPKGGNYNGEQND